MQLRFPILCALAACNAVDTTTTQAPISQTFSLADQTAAVAARDARRKAAYDPNLRTKTKPVDWLHVRYHGQVIDRNFDPVVLDPQTIDTIQVSIFAELYPSLGAAANAKYGKDLAVLFAAKGMNPRERAEARATAIDGLLTVANTAQLERMRWRNETLRGGIAQVPWQYTIAPEVLAQIRSQGIPVYTPPPGQAYIDACAAQQVPIPPNWPDAEWVRQGSLGFTFLPSGPTDVHTYRTDEGLCFALPRYVSVGGELAFNGIICQSKITGKACFWDNITRPATDVWAVFGAETRRLRRADYPLRIGQIGDGYTLAENCTDCHRGDNVFNVHPGTFLDQPDTAAPVPYTPIGRRAFVNPPPRPPVMPPEVDAANRSCDGCHTIPTLSELYCNSVLEDAARVTMPKPTPADMEPWRPANWPPVTPPETLRPDYARHVTILKDACDAL